MSSSLCFFAKSMKAFMGLFGRFGSKAFFTGETGGDRTPSVGGFMCAEAKTACCSSGVKENL
jgi:hypothetical protein